jgi:hypothetical protein
MEGEEGEGENGGKKEKKTGGGVYNDEDITRWDRVMHFPTLFGLCNPDYVRHWQPPSRNIHQFPRRVHRTTTAPSFHLQ